MLEQREALIQFVIIGTVLFLLVAIFMVSFIFIYRKKQNKFLVEKLDMENKFQQELLRTQLEIQEQTFKNISQEIHDNIGQTLSLAKLNLNTIDVDTETKTGEKIFSSKELVSKAIQDLRSLSRTLNTDTILSSGLLKAIEYELQVMDKSGVFRTELKIAGNPIKIDAQKELILFRILQEALNNIIKHAQATEIIVETSFRDHAFSLCISDNGRGFRTSIKNDLSAGSGLNNMRSRAQLIGGRIDIESSTASGTKIQVTVPITET